MSKAKRIWSVLIIIVIKFSILFPILDCVNAEPVVNHTKTASAEIARSVSLQLSLGYLTGQAHEYVYITDIHPDMRPYVGNKLSELIWDIDNLYMIGAAFSVPFNSWITGKTSFWFKLDAGEGTMNDYDWRILGNSNWTDWSHHDDTPIIHAKMWDIQLKFFPNARIGEYLSFSGMLGYKSDTFEWESYGGSAIYSSDTGFRDIQVSFNENIRGISYQQQYTAPYWGLSLIGHFKKFVIEGEAFFSAWAQCKAIDHHYLADFVTDEDFNDGVMTTVKIGGSFRFYPYMLLSLVYSITDYRTMKGDSLRTDNEDGVIMSYYYKDGAGANLEKAMLYASLIFEF